MITKDTSKNAFLNWALKVAESGGFKYRDDEDCFEHIIKTQRDENLCYTVIVGKYPLQKQYSASAKMVILLRPGEKIEELDEINREQAITSHHDERVTKIYNTLFNNKNKPTSFWEVAQANINLY